MDQAQKDNSFWKEMNRLVTANSIIIDRAKGSSHPHYPDVIYPLDYRYLADTRSGDGAGIGVWLGSLKREKLTGILCTFDTLKHDAEIKLLIDCTKEDVDS